MNSYNVVFLGKSGVGKSTLINYLFGKNIRETGTGRPVTKQGFHPKEIQINNVPSMLFDSWGLEPGKEKDWLKALDGALKERGINKSPNEWFHSIFFCISGNHRVEELELDIIGRIVDEAYPITVLFTKADLISESELEAMKEPINRKFGSRVPMIPVSSEEKKTRRGIIKPSGKEEIELEILKDFSRAIQLRLPKRCIYRIEQYIQNWESSQRTYLYENTGIFKRKKPYEGLREHIQQFAHHLNQGVIEQNIMEELETTLKMYVNFASGLNFQTNLPFIRILDYKFKTSIPEYDMFDTFAMIFANIIFPIGIFFTKEQNYEHLCEELENATSLMKKEIGKLEPQITELIRGMVSSEA